jgi:hypothetical protein
MIVLLRAWATDGLSFRLLPPLLCLLLWILATQVTERTGFKYIAGTLALFGAALAQLYDATGRRNEALTVAKQIVDKKIKIPSSTIVAIKKEMRQLIEKEENRAPSDQPNNNLTRQGETPEVQPRGNAIPP